MSLDNDRLTFMLIGLVDQTRIRRIGQNDQAISVHTDLFRLLFRMRCSREFVQNYLIGDL